MSSELKQYLAVHVRHKDMVVVSRSDGLQQRNEHRLDIVIPIGAYTRIVGGIAGDASGVLAEQHTLFLCPVPGGKQQLGAAHSDEAHHNNQRNNRKIFGKDTFKHAHPAFPLKVNPGITARHFPGP